MSKLLPKWRSQGRGWLSGNPPQPSMENFFNLLAFFEKKISTHPPLKFFNQKFFFYPPPKIQATPLLFRYQRHIQGVLRGSDYAPAGRKWIYKTSVVSRQAWRQNFIFQWRAASMGIIWVYMGTKKLIFNKII